MRLLHDDAPRLEVRTRAKVGQMDTWLIRSFAPTTDPEAEHDGSDRF
jgi:hypothetical protein